MCFYHNILIKMGRTIEFRCWLQYKKQMLSDRLFDVDTWQDVIVLKENSANFSYFGDIKSCELMQFSSQIDKNNKKIFEGDILQDFRKTFKYKCIFRENGCFEFQNLTTLNFALLYELHDAEVIGNYFENPELLQ